jgi:hypothetical protein
VATTKDARPVIEGWKEIAKYFDRSVRSVQAWESQGLKIHRFQKRVLAYVDDLEEYKSTRLLMPPNPQTSSDIPQEVESDHLASGQEVKNSISEPTPLGPPSRARGLWSTRQIYVAIGALAVASLSAILLVVRPHTYGVPALCELRASTLIVKDAQGRQLFRHQFTEPMASLDQLSLPRVWAAGDIDGDGQTELVFAYRPPFNPETLDRTPSEVFCFSPVGRIKWRFVPGRPVVTDHAGKKYFPPYFAAAIKLLAGREPGEVRIVVSSIHHMEYPSQVAVLNGRGKLIGEYWHPGWLRLIASADIDHSGNEKILLAGINNGEHSATLIVFDPARVSGTAKQLGDAKFGFPGMPRGTEEAVVLFPRSCVSRLGPRSISYNRDSELRVTKDRIFVIVTEGFGEPEVPRLTYELDYDLNVLSVEPNEAFGWKHAEMEKQGILDHKLTPEDLRDIGARVIVRRATNVMANIAH